MFDRLTWRRRHRGAPRETRYQPHVSDGERPMARLAGIADDVEAGRIEPPSRWSFERPRRPGVDHAGRSALRVQPAGGTAAAP